MIAERADRQGPPPAIFWRAPVDSESASFSRASDPARVAPILHTLRLLLEGKLAKEQIGSEADRKALGALLSDPLGKDTNIVFASGHASLPPRPAGKGGKLTEDEIAEEIAQGYLGWYLIGFDEGPAAPSKVLKEAVAAYGRKGLVDPLRKALGRDAEILPTVKTIPAPAQLGKGALDVEMHFDLSRRKSSDDKKKKGAGLSIHILLMGEAQSTWIGVSSNRDDLVKHLLAAKSGAPEAGTLAARSGLEAIRSGKALGSGFVTVGMFTRSLGNVLHGPLVSGATSGPLADFANTLDHLPHKGDTPIFFTSTAQSAGPRSELTFDMTKGSFEDVGAILMTLNRIAESQGLLRP
jgi:hypothetical protein